MKVAVFGLGYVGTVTAAVLASNSHEVCGIDIDDSKAASITDGRSPVIEPGIEELVHRSVAAGRLTATTDPCTALDGAEVSLVCVGTPSSPTGSTDLTYVMRAAHDIASALASARPSRSGCHSLVVRSTVPPGTIQDDVAPLISERMAGSPLHVGIGMCPEFLREGVAIADFYDTPLTVLGTEDPHVAETVKDMFSFLRKPVHVVTTREAEALKYACNAFHATKISFANEIGRLFRLLGVDARHVMDLFCEDTKLNLSANYLSPGFAFGGSCLPKDLRSLLHLARMNSVDLPLLAGALATNELSIDDVVNRVLATDARSVALLGLSFKMDSDDLRESPYVDLAETLIGKGFDVRIYDPIVDTSRLVGSNRQYLISKLPHVQRTLQPSPSDALRGVDLALVSSSHPLVTQSLMQTPPRMVIDLNGRLDAALETLPNYEGVAW